MHKYKNNFSIECKLVIIYNLNCPKMQDNFILMFQEKGQLPQGLSSFFVSPNIRRKYMLIYDWIIKEMN